MIISILYIQSQKVADKSVEVLKPKWAAPPSKFLELEGMSVHFRDEGSRDDLVPIILIHGTGASLHTWDGWVDALKDTRRVIRFDLPAFGLTGPHPDNDYTIESYAKFVIGMMNKLKVEQAVLAGNSLGGYIAWASELLYSNRVSKLVLIDASGYPYESESVPLAFKISQNELASKLLKNFMPRWLVAKSVENVYANPKLVNNELIERYYQLTQRAGNRSALKQRFIQTQPGELAKRVSDIQAETLILWGAKDKLIPLKFAYRFDSEISNSKLVIFDNLGHVPHEENPEISVAPLLSFLNIK